VGFDHGDVRRGVEYVRSDADGAARIDDDKMLKVVQKLKKNFWLVNLHFNNFACSPQWAPIPGVAYQVLFVNKRLGVLDPSKGYSATESVERTRQPGSGRLPAAGFLEVVLRIRTLARRCLAHGTDRRRIEE
jgi:hypothetical protein